jgi:hypothetical protein
MQVKEKISLEKMYALFNAFVKFSHGSGCVCVLHGTFALMINKNCGAVSWKGQQKERCEGGACR